MAGISGLLGGLGAKFGGAARGAQDALLGAPTFAATSNDVPPGLLGEEALRRPPTLTPTGQREGGLLSGFLNTDESGISGRDRLFAMGSILQGDSGGAQTYLQGQRTAATAANDRKRRDELERGGLEALNSAFDERGNFDMPRYLAKVRQLGLDPSAGLKMAESLAPKISLQNAGGGGLYEVTQGPFGGGASTRELVAPQAKAPGRLMQDPETGEWVPNPAYADAIEAEARARRTGAPPVGRGGGGGRSRAAPASLPPDQIVWGK